MILNGNALHLPLADQSVQCAITSPPYWGLRDYGIGGQLGLEPTPDCGAWSRGKHEPYIEWRIDDDSGEREPVIVWRRTEKIQLCGVCYVCNMVAVFREVWRVLRDDGTLWLNLGDSYVGGGGFSQDAPTTKDSKSGKYGLTGALVSGGIKPVSGLKPKDLVGIPWRVAFALQADGWYLRSDIIWAKPNPMPESVTDRPTKAHEYVFLLSKQARYYYDADAVREANSEPERTNWDHGMKLDSSRNDHYERPFGTPGIGRNRRTVWNIATQPYSGAHFATFPEALVEPCLLAGTSERGCCPVCGTAWRRVVEKEDDGTRQPGNERAIAMGHSANGPTAMMRAGEAKTSTTTGWLPACEHDAPPVPCVVLDPFSGSGTVGVVAQRHGRKFVGVELSLPYIALAKERIAKANGYHVGRLI